MYQNCCKKCGSTDLFLKEKGTNTGLYCSDCGAWIKWVNKDEKRAFEHSKKDATNKKAQKNSCDLAEEIYNTRGKDFCIGLIAHLVMHTTGKYDERG